MRSPARESAVRHRWGADKGCSIDLGSDRRFPWPVRNRLDNDLPSSRACRHCEQCARHLPAIRCPPSPGFAGRPSHKQAEPRGEKRRAWVLPVVRASEGFRSPNEPGEVGVEQRMIRQVEALQRRAAEGASAESAVLAMRAETCSGAMGIWRGSAGTAVCSTIGSPLVARRVLSNCSRRNRQIRAWRNGQDREAPPGLRLQSIICEIAFHAGLIRIPTERRQRLVQLRKTDEPVETQSDRKDVGTPLMTFPIWQGLRYFGPTVRRYLWRWMQQASAIACRRPCHPPSPPRSGSSTEDRSGNEDRAISTDDDSHQ